MSFEKAKNNDCFNFACILSFALHEDITQIDAISKIKYLIYWKVS